MQYETEKNGAKSPGCLVLPSYLFGIREYCVVYHICPHFVVHAGVMLPRRFEKDFRCRKRHHADWDIVPRLEMYVRYSAVANLDTRRA